MDSFSPCWSGTTTRGSWTSLCGIKGGGEEGENGWILCEDIASKIIDMLGEEKKVRVFQEVLLFKRRVLRMLRLFQLVIIYVWSSP